jgi:hypothetical protein
MFSDLPHHGGVKSTKQMQVDGNDMILMLLDIYREDDFQKLQCPTCAALGFLWLRMGRAAPRSIRRSPLGELTRRSVSTTVGLEQM